VKSMEELDTFRFKVRQNLYIPMFNNLLEKNYYKLISHIRISACLMVASATRE
jgi:hypothetical protein